MFHNKSWDEWINEYAQSHQHPMNRLCHTVGIPMVALSVVMLLLAIFLPKLWGPAIGLFVVGWIFQFVGHAYEKKPPEFFHDWRFLFVGLRWWLRKISKGY